MAMLATVILYAGAGRVLLSDLVLGFILLLFADALDPTGFIHGLLERGSRIHTGSFFAHWLLRLAVHTALLAAACAIIVALRRPYEAFRRSR
jgi:hypothetical protein